MEEKMEAEMETLDVWAYKEDLSKEQTTTKVRYSSGFRVSGFRRGMDRNFFSCLLGLWFFWSHC